MAPQIQTFLTTHSMLYIFRAFRNHKQVDPLELPGTSDLTADVDFSYLKSQVHKCMEKTIKANNTRSGVIRL